MFSATPPKVSQLTRLIRLTNLRRGSFTVYPAHYPNSPTAMLLLQPAVIRRLEIPFNFQAGYELAGSPCACICTELMQTNPRAEQIRCKKKGRRNIRRP